MYFFQTTDLCFLGGFEQFSHSRLLRRLTLKLALSFAKSQSNPALNCSWIHRFGSHYLLLTLLTLRCFSHLDFINLWRLLFATLRGRLWAPPLFSPLLRWKLKSGQSICDLCSILSLFHLFLSNLLPTTPLDYGSFYLFSCPTFSWSMISNLPIGPKEIFCSLDTDLRAKCR